MALFPLHCASQKGNLSQVIRLIRQGFTVDARDSKNRTPLHLAVKSNRLKVVKYLVRQPDCDLDATDQDGNTPMWTAALNNRTYLVELLIESGADMAVRDNRGRNILHYAASLNWKCIVNCILKRGTLDLNQKSAEGKTGLLIASSLMYKDIMQLLIAAGADASVCDASQMNLLHHAALCNWPDIINSVLKSQALDVNCKRHDGMTPIMLAVTNLHYDVVNLLIAAGADLSISNKAGENILHLVAYDNFLDEAKIVLESRKLDVNAKNSIGYTALIVAAREGHTDFIKLLFEHGADISVRDRHEFNVLHHASVRNQVAVAEIALERGEFDVNVLTTNGYTPLMWAAYRGHTQLAILLLAHGADIQVCTPKPNINDFPGGWNALHLAVFNDHFDIVKIFLEWGELDVNRKTLSGTLALDLAAFALYRALLLDKKNTLLDIMRLLVDHGAYFTHSVLFEVRASRVIDYYKRMILIDPDLLTKIIVNMFNMNWLPMIYDKLKCAVKLPRVASLKVHHSQNVAVEIKKCVVNEIGRKTYCDVAYVQPPVLKLMCARSLIGYLSCKRSALDDMAG